MIILIMVIITLMIYHDMKFLLSPIPILCQGQSGFHALHDISGSDLDSESNHVC